MQFDGLDFTEGDGFYLSESRIPAQNAGRGVERCFAMAMVARVGWGSRQEEVPPQAPIAP